MTHHVFQGLKAPSMDVLSVETVSMDVLNFAIAIESPNLKLLVQLDLFADLSRWIVRGSIFRVCFIYLIILRH